MRLDDDGSAVTVDLHGLSVGDAVAVAARALRLAARRGRHSVRLVHGSSTSSAAYRNRTIKHALYDALDAGTLAPTTGALRLDDALVLSLPLDAPSDPTRMRLADVW